jgi:hypothetical protein
MERMAGVTTPQFVHQALEVDKSFQPEGMVIGGLLGKGRDPPGRFVDPITGGRPVFTNEPGYIVFQFGGGWAP